MKMELSIFFRFFFMFARQIDKSTQIPRKMNLNKTYLGRAMLAFVGASEYVHRLLNTCRVILWTLIDVDASQVDINA